MQFADSFAEGVFCVAAPKAFGLHYSATVTERRFKEQNAKRPMPNCAPFTRCCGASVVGDQPFAYAAAPPFLPFAADAAVGLLPAFAESYQARGHQAPELGLKTASEAYSGAEAYFGASDQELVGRWR